MDTATFLRRVLAPTGNIVVSALKPGATRKDDRFWNTGNFTTPEDAAAEAAKVDADQHLTAYFAVGTHQNNTEPKANGKGTKYLRRQATAAYFKSLCFDLDIGIAKGSPYATQKEGMTALVTALKTFGFPAPMVVNSGVGIHCYWPLVDEVPAVKWVEASKALRLALRDGGVVIDESKIHDASMVLRPVGTHHKKSSPWKPVAVVLDSPDYDFADLVSRLAKWIGADLPARPKSPTAVNPTGLKKPSAISDAILKGGYEPLNLAVVGAKCLQLAALIASGGATDAMGRPVAEPMWRGSLGVAAYATDKQDAIMQLCGKHPQFDLADNLNKLANWKGTGVTLCSYFEQHCATGCNGCPHKGQIKSPAALNALTHISITSVDTDDGTEKDVAPVPLPDGYFAAMDKIWTEVEVEKTVKDAEGKSQKITVTERVKVCDYPLVVLDRYTDAELRSKTTILWAVKFPGTSWRQYEMPSDVLAMGGTELSKYFMNKQVFVGNDALLSRMRTYIVRYLECIQRMSDTGLDIASLGWQPDGSFLCGERLITKAGEQMKWRPTASLKLMSNKVGRCGNRDHWIGMTSILNKPCAYHIGFATMIAGSGLLLPAAGIESFVYSMHSPGSGTGKTFALLFGNSLFGHPKKLLLQPSDTKNALFQIMGTLGNLSAAMDEITTMNLENAAHFAFEAQTGREKFSLSQGRELREGVHWSAPLRVTTNTSLYYMYDIYKSKNEAEKVRTLEMLIDEKEFVDTHDVQGLARELEDNHGFAITEIAEEIIRRGGVRTVYDHYAQEFAARFAFKFLGVERFFAGGIIAAYGFGRVAQDLGLFQFDVDATTQWGLDRVLQLRQAREGAKQDAFDVLGLFLSDYNNQIVVLKTDAATAGAKPIVQMPTPDLAVARMEINYDKTANVLPGSKLMINTAKLREWAKRTREDVATILYELKKNNVIISEGTRVSLYKGTHHNNPGQANCLVLNLMHPRFAAVMNTHKAIVSTNPALAILQGGKP